MFNRTQNTCIVLCFETIGIFGFVFFNKVFCFALFFFFFRFLRRQVGDEYAD